MTIFSSQSSTSTSFVATIAVTLLVLVSVLATALAAGGYVKLEPGISKGAFSLFSDIERNTLIVVEYSAHLIQAFNLSSGLGYTVAGTGTSPSVAPSAQSVGTDFALGGPTYCALLYNPGVCGASSAPCVAADYVCVVHLSHTLVKIGRDAPNGAQTLAGTFGTAGADNGSPGTLRYPLGVVTDPKTRTTVIADRANHRLRLLAWGGGAGTSTSSLSLLSGTGATGAKDGAALTATWHEPNFLAVAFGTTLLISEYGNVQFARLRRLFPINASTGVVSMLFDPSNSVPDGYLGQGIAVLIPPGSAGGHLVFVRESKGGALVLPLPNRSFVESGAVPWKISWPVPTSCAPVELSLQKDAAFLANGSLVTTRESNSTAPTNYDLFVSSSGPGVCLHNDSVFPISSDTAQPSTTSTSSSSSPTAATASPVTTTETSTTTTMTESPSSRSYEHVSPPVVADVASARLRLKFFFLFTHTANSALVQLTWNEAQKWCNDQSLSSDGLPHVKGELPSVTSVEINNAIARQESTLPSVAWWTAGHTGDAGGSNWRWRRGTTPANYSNSVVYYAQATNRCATSAYCNWREDEPSALSSSSSSSAPFAMTLGAYKNGLQPGTWAAEPVSTGVAFTVCAFRLPSGVPADQTWGLRGFLDVGTQNVRLTCKAQRDVQYNYKVYSFFQNFLRWPDAQDVCASSNLTLTDTGTSPSTVYRVPGQLARAVDANATHLLSQNCLKEIESDCWTSGNSVMRAPSWAGAPDNIIFRWGIGDAAVDFFQHDTAGGGRGCLTPTKFCRWETNAPVARTAPTFVRLHAFDRPSAQNRFFTDFGTGVKAPFVCEYNINHLRAQIAASSYLRSQLPSDCDYKRDGLSSAAGGGITIDPARFQLLNTVIAVACFVLFIAWFLYRRKQMRDRNAQHERAAAESRQQGNQLDAQLIMGGVAGGGGGAAVVGSPRMMMMPPAMQNGAGMQQNNNNNNNNDFMPPPPAGYNFFPGTEMAAVTGGGGAAGAAAAAYPAVPPGFGGVASQDPVEQMLRAQPSGVMTHADFSNNLGDVGDLGALQATRSAVYRDELARSSEYDVSGGTMLNNQNPLG